MTAGQRVRIVGTDRLFRQWDDRNHRIGTTGVVIRLPLARPRFFSERLVIVRHDDGVQIAYGLGQIRPIEDDDEA